MQNTNRNVRVLKEGSTWDSPEEMLKAATDNDGRLWIFVTLFTIDTAVGLYTYLFLVLGFTRETLPPLRLVFSGDDVPDDIIPLEFDVQDRYRQRRIGSATEACYIDHRLGVFDDRMNRIVGSRIPGAMEMFGYLRDNNGNGEDKKLGGYLKKKRFSNPLSFILRKAESNTEMLRMMLVIVEAWFEFRASGKDLDLDGFGKAYPDLMESLDFRREILEQPESGFNKMSVACVVLHTVGRDEATVRGVCDFFTSVIKGVEDRNRAVKKHAKDISSQLKEGTGDHRIVEASFGQVLLVHTDMEEVIRPLFNAHPRAKLIISRKPNGQVAFMPNNHTLLRMKGLWEHLKMLEPGLWYLMGHGRKFIVINGGAKVSHLVRPTGLSDDELVNAVLRYVRLGENRRGSRSRGHRRRS